MIHVILARFTLNNFPPSLKEPLPFSSETWTKLNLYTWNCRCDEEKEHEDQQLLNVTSPKVTDCTYIAPKGSGFKKNCKDYIRQINLFLHHNETQSIVKKEPILRLCFQWMHAQKMRQMAWHWHVVHVYLTWKFVEQN